MSKIGDIIREKRKEKHLSQKKLAEESGLCVATIQGYEQGLYNPKMPSIIKISDALGIDPMEIFSVVINKKDVTLCQSDCDTMAP